MSPSPTPPRSGNPRFSKESPPSRAQDRSHGSPPTVGPVPFRTAIFMVLAVCIVAVAIVLIDFRWGPVVFLALMGLVLLAGAVIQGHDQ